MGKSFILLRSSERDELTEPATQFAELTGAYWLEPIYAGLASEWSRRGKTVPGTPRGRPQVIAEGPDEPEPGAADEPG